MSEDNAHLLLLDNQQPTVSVSTLRLTLGSGRFCLKRLIHKWKVFQIEGTGPLCLLCHESDAVELERCETVSASTGCTLFENFEHTSCVSTGTAKGQTTLRGERKSAAFIPTGSLLFFYFFKFHKCQHSFCCTHLLLLDNQPLTMKSVSTL